MLRSYGVLESLLQLLIVGTPLALLGVPPGAEPLLLGLKSEDWVYKGPMEALAVQRSGVMNRTAGIAFFKLSEAVSRVVRLGSCSFGLECPGEACSMPGFGLRV